MLAIAYASKRCAAQARARGASSTCPTCRGAEWVKGYTPWGCPTSIRCPTCHTAKAQSHRTPPGKLAVA